jgi:hypothetical protein
MNRIAGLLPAALFSVATALAQVSTGTPAFSSMGGGPADAVNLGNLNVHLVIPVLHKAGRGVPFCLRLGLRQFNLEPCCIRRRDAVARSHIDLVDDDRKGTLLHHRQVGVCRQMRITAEWQGRTNGWQ